MTAEHDTPSLFGDDPPPALAHFTRPQANQEASDPMASGYAIGRDQHNRVRPPNAPCRSCKAPMLWVTLPSGKRNPLDAEPSPDGNILLLELQDRGGRPWRLATVVQNDDLLAEARELGVPLYRSHFATCPDAEEHRREQMRFARRGIE